MVCTIHSRAQLNYTPAGRREEEVCTASKMLCAKKSRAWSPMSAGKQNVTHWWLNAGASLPPGKSQIKLQFGMRSLCMGPGTKVCQKSHTWSSYINGLIKATSQRTPRLLSWQLNRRPLTLVQWHTVSTALCKILYAGCASNMQSLSLSSTATLSTIKTGE